MVREIVANPKSPANTNTMKKKYRRVLGKNLIEGNIYYTDDEGHNKVVYEGRLEEDKLSCLFTPIGNTNYLLYGEHHYDGKYVGKYTLRLDGYFYKEIN